MDNTLSRRPSSGTAEEQWLTPSSHRRAGSTHRCSSRRFSQDVRRDAQLRQPQRPDPAGLASASTLPDFQRMDVAVGASSAGFPVSLPPALLGSGRLDPTPRRPGLPLGLVGERTRDAGGPGRRGVALWVPVPRRALQTHPALFGEGWGVGRSPTVLPVALLSRLMGECRASLSAPAAGGRRSGAGGACSRLCGGAATGPSGPA